ncbi:MULTISPECIES: DUF4314 domain-containing protein [unclassified Micromonospora]|uniref:DUF4314 domain-containing protein n=1 Tax=unclassified Micromonospora TaxID=2617518 RepID=UPI001C2486C0|nr:MULTISPECIES: DUF4314 domain-containing protein [unclassified Micromonospora]MBU8857756.1 DUF4314 domain-containing protein [Micromonospora sp. WMMB482]MDM4783383.1 DUF4314 domain-containing protein [Micromonospora sp. b486]
MTSPTSNSHPEGPPAADDYRRGDRVALRHTSDPYTRLRPGDEGTVRGYDPDQRILDVAWDSGSRLSMTLDDGDRVRPLPDPAWQPVLTALREAGVAAGRDAAQWWAQDTIGGRAHGDVAGAARAVLAAIETADGRDIDGLPFADRDDAAGRARYAEHAPPGASAWTALTSRQADQARQAWCDGFDHGVEAETARQCRMVLHPDGDDRDLRHVYPDAVRVGGPGVFAGDWAATPDADGQARFPVGFAGTLIDWWNGWAVFRCTRQVAEAIVADQQTHRDRYRRHLLDGGATDSDADRQVDESLGRMWFDGDVIVADDSRVQGDPDAVDRISPDADGQYVVMGWNWTWQAVHPYDCDRIAGTIPDPPPTTGRVSLSGGSSDA